MNGIMPILVRICCVIILYVCIKYILPDFLFKLIVPEVFCILFMVDLLANMLICLAKKEPNKPMPYLQMIVENLIAYMIAVIIIFISNII